MGVFDRVPDVESAKEAELVQTKPESDVLEITSEANPEVKVWVRTKVTKEDVDQVTNRFVNRLARMRPNTRHASPFTRGQVSAEDHLKLADRIWVEHLLVRWNLPISLEDKQKAVSKLSDADCHYIYNKIQELQPSEAVPRAGLGTDKRLRKEVLEAEHQRQQ